MRKLIGFLFLTTGLILLFMVGCNVYVVFSTKDRVISDPYRLPHHEAALVFGTSSRVVGGGTNLFFTYRMDKAAELFRLQKVTRLILSGDSRSPDYNEPAMMLEAMLKRGIPNDFILLDKSGLRTLDSVVRSREVFGQESVILVTQTFHAYRALYLCDYFGIPAGAFAAEEPEGGSGWLVYFREFFARTKAVLDVHLLGTQPKSLTKG